MIRGSVLVTGGTGSLGRRLVEIILAEHETTRLVVYSRDEHKQAELQQRIGDPRLRCYIGDVRDAERLVRAMAGVQFVVHAAALKRVESCELDPFEAIKTNVIGSQNVISCALDQGVARVVAASTDKAAAPAGVYGASKLCADRLFLAARRITGDAPTSFAVVRFGNLAGARGSVIPLFRARAAAGEWLPITDERMTRFWITLDHAARFVVRVLEDRARGLLWVPKAPSARIVDVARAVAPDAEYRVVGIRPGESLHETLISAVESREARDIGDAYVLGGTDGERVPEGWSYSSDTTPDRLDAVALRGLLEGA